MCGSRAAVLKFVSFIFLVPSIFGREKCDQLVSVEDFHQYARENVNPKAFTYIESAAGYGDTMRWNTESFRSIRLYPRFMVDVSKRNLATKVLGQQIAFPVGAAPAAAHKNAHPDGEIATAKACSATGALMIHSSKSTVTMEEVAAAGGPNLTFWQEVEIYVPRNMTLDLIRRAEKAGAKAIVVCIDCYIMGIRYVTYKEHYVLPEGARFANFIKYGAKGPVNDLAVSWEDLSWITKNTKLPVVVKGILTSQDAVKAVKHGAKGIIVSNHGGRQVDGFPATIEVLPEIVREVKGNAEVYLDSGIRTGMDVLKALVYGARTVFIGRPLLYGLSYKGEIGLKCVLELLRDELDNVMALTGETDVNNITAIIKG